MILVTGGAGFIGSNFILDWCESESEPVLDLDKLTYAGNLHNLDALRGDARHVFVRGDICDRRSLRELLARHRPRAIVHFAAESHVDRSIHAPDDFVQTNVVGTFNLLMEAQEFWSGLGAAEARAFRFVQVSTDEVYGSLGEHDPAFTEATPCAPNSPYSASKAAADHMARAIHRTYGLPVVTTRCSNNYGPYQFPEKLVPLMIHNALAGKPLPVYGDGRHVRDWLYVRDHCSALREVLKNGRAGDTYNIGGGAEKANLDTVGTVCALLDELRPRATGSYRDLVTFVADRPGHDRRYAIDASRIQRELGWRARESFESGMRKTVQWYLDNARWVERVVSGEYRDWIVKQYGSSAT